MRQFFKYKIENEDKKDIVPEYQFPDELLPEVLKAAHYLQA